MPCFLCNTITVRVKSISQWRICTYSVTDKSVDDMSGSPGDVSEEPVT